MVGWKFSWIDEKEEEEEWKTELGGRLDLHPSTTLRRHGPSALYLFSDKDGART